MGEECHRRAAELLCEKFVTEDFDEHGIKVSTNIWGHRFVSGGLPGGDYAHVFIETKA